jgi:hypothetical protein
VVKTRPSATPPIAPYGPRRVGFNLRFSVKLALLWAAESDPLRDFRDGKHFKKLIKMAEKGEFAKRDVYHIDRSGAHLGFQIRLLPTEVASGLGFRCAEPAQPIFRRAAVPT